MTRSLLSIAASTALVLFSANASAHVRLVNPLPRHPTPDREDDTIKTAPCGVLGDSRTTDESRITVYEPGETITIEFAETIDHPGFYRVSFDDDGQDAFDAPLSRSDVMETPALPVLLDDIEDHGVGGYSVEVTLPNIECENCTLQLIQVMSSAQSWNAGEIYYTCADIALRASGSGSGGIGGMGGSASGGAGAGGTTEGGGPPMGGAGSGGVSAGAAGMSAGSGGSSAGSSGLGGGGAGGAAGTTAAGGASGAGSGAAGGGSGGGAGTAGTGAVGGVNAAGSAGTGAAGVSGTNGTDGDIAAEDPGCGCRTATTGGGARSLSLVAAALALLGLRRRRR